MAKENIAGVKNGVKSTFNIHFKQHFTTIIHQVRSSGVNGGFATSFQAETRLSRPTPIRQYSRRMLYAYFGRNTSNNAADCNGPKNLIHDRINTF